jgi:hypothetical protein
MNSKTTTTSASNHTFAHSYISFLVYSSNVLQYQIMSGYLLQHQNAISSKMLDDKKLGLDLVLWLFQQCGQSRQTHQPILVSKRATAFTPWVMVHDDLGGGG